MPSRRAIVLACLTLASLTPARAQEADAPPADLGGVDPRWTQAIEAVAHTLDGTRPPASMAAFAWPYASIVPFGRNRAESYRLLTARVPAGLPVVSARAFTTPAVTAASDLIADLEKSEDVPPAVLKRFVPPTDEAAPDARVEAIRRADQTMARWLAVSLEASAPGTPVGVIALYDDGTHAPGGVPTVWFALVRGHVDATGAVGISRILYGPMSAATR